MNPQQRWQLRLSLLSELIAQAPGKLGRTAVMKLAYFLQTLKGVPLDYHFSLYTYGPFDSDVLNDVSQIESLGAVKSEMISFASGYGYEFSIGSKRENLLKLTGSPHMDFQEAIQWVLNEFGSKKAADLELLSTIVFADQEAARHPIAVSHEELSRQVKEIKQRFSLDYILQNVRELHAKGILVGSRETM